LCFFVLHVVLSKLTGTFPSLHNGWLKSVTLDTNQLSGSVPLLHLPRCATLTAANNQLSGTLPERFFDGLPAIRSLDLSSNQLEGAIPSAAAPIHLFQTFSLSFNRFSGPLPENITANLVSIGNKHRRAHAGSQPVFGRLRFDFI